MDSLVKRFSWERIYTTALRKRKGETAIGGKLEAASDGPNYIGIISFPDYKTCMQKPGLGLHQPYGTTYSSGTLEIHVILYARDWLQLESVRATTF